MESYKKENKKLLNAQILQKEVLNYKNRQILELKNENRELKKQIAALSKQYQRP